MLPWLAQCNELLQQVLCRSLQAYAAYTMGYRSYGVKAALHGSRDALR